MVVEMHKNWFRPAVVAAILIGCLSLSSAALAVSNVTGQADFTYGPGATSSSGGATAQNGTGVEAESKLFYTPDGAWWGVLGSDSPGPGGVSLYRSVDHQWQPVSSLPGSDPWMKADVLYDSAQSKLYVSLRDTKALTGNPRVSLLYIYNYGADGTWTLQSGPTTITKKNSRNLTLALDSQGQIWVTFTNNHLIYVGNTAPGGTSFTFQNMSWTSLASNDTSAVASFGTAASGYKIGVMWDDSITQRYMFAWRNDTDPLGTWNVETAYGDGVGGCPTSTTSACANYHISLRSNGDDVYAALKLLSQSSTNPLDPMIVLAHRDPAGLWGASTVSYKNQGASRQILLLAPEQDRVYVVAESPKSGLFVWESSLQAPNFDPMAYQTWAIPNQNAHENPTSTKQPLSSSGEAMVESSQGLINQYWRNEFSAF